MTYPILVARFTGQQSLTIVCEVCHAERQISPDDINQDAAWPCPAGIEHAEAEIPDHPGCFGRTATFKYDEGERCKGCGSLGYWEKALDYCCSRKCMLQAEYAATLKGRAA